MMLGVITAPKTIQADEVNQAIEGQPELEAGSQAAPQNGGGENGAHSEPNLGSDPDSSQPGLASDGGDQGGDQDGDNSLGDHQGHILPPDNNGEPQDQDVNTEGTRVGDEREYAGPGAQADDLPGGPIIGPQMISFLTSTHYGTC